MIKNIIEKEWLEYKQDKKLYWIIGSLYLLFIIALISGANYYTSVTKQSSIAQKASYEQWLRQGKKNPHSAAHYGFYAYKPLSALAIIDKGMENYLGQAVWLEAHNQNEVKERDATDAGSIVRFGNLNVAFIFVVLLPLAIILLGFNIFSKEREWGTLPLLLSSSTSAKAILKSKALAFYQLVVLTFLPMLVIAAIAILYVAGAGEIVKVLPHFIFLSVFLLMYYAVWVLLSLYISSLVKQSAVSLVGLLAFWLFGTFLLPRVGGIVAKAIYPTPSSFSFSNNIRLDNELGIDRNSPASLRQKLFEDSLLKKYAVDSLTKLPLNIRGLNLERGEEYGYLIFEKNYGGLENTYRKQDAVMNALNIFSPVQSMRSISAGFSGTDINKQSHFAALAENHRRLIAQTMNDDIAANSVGIANYEVDANFWKKIPPFQYKEASFVAVTQFQLFPLISILVWLCCLIILLQKRAVSIKGV
ncbi:MAG: DUF3526 domain-containing protein [Sediminibacterium sp.]